MGGIRVMPEQNYWAGAPAAGAGRKTSDVDWGRLGGNAGLKDAYERGTYTPPKEYMIGASSEAGGSGASGGDINITADEYKPLVDLQNRYSGYLDDFNPATDKGAIRLGQDIRDLNSGAASERAAGYAARGLRGAGSGDASSMLENQANVDTTRAAGRAMSNYREGRANAYGEAIRGGVGVAGAPAELAMREKEFAARSRMAEANLQLQQSQNSMDQYLALLNSQRSSPIYEPPQQSNYGQIAPRRPPPGGLAGGDINFGGAIGRGGGYGL